MPFEIKDTDAQTVLTKFRYNDAKESGRSIIEDWKNPPKICNDILRSDELYEERAIDVVVDHHPHQSLSKRNNNTNDKNNGKENTTKAKSQNNATTRSIPIKNYQASIAHNVGTLRRSEAPQLQFESSTFKPERNFCKASKHRGSSRNNAKALEATCTANCQEIIDPPRKSCHSCENQRESCRINSKLRTLDRRVTRSGLNPPADEEDQEISDFDDYFRRSSSRRLNSNYRNQDNLKNKDDSNDQKIDNTKAQDDQSYDSGEWVTTNFERGHVGQKISVYEENARRSTRNWGPKCQLNSETGKHRTIGVPLVGMHNACGLPVVASWHNHELLEPLRITNRLVGTLRPVLKAPRATSGVRRRTHPKRRAPQPNENHFKKNDCSNTKSVASGTDKVSRRKDRRPSFKSAKVGTSSSKSSVRRRSRTSTYKRNSLTNSLGKKSLSIGSTKRKTLYARDDGEDAVQVLRSLCLNPLAQTKSGAGMIW